jgi:hypothetical protein
MAENPVFRKLYEGKSSPSMARSVKVMVKKLPTNTPTTAIAVTGFFINGASGLKKDAKVPRITRAKNFGNRDMFSSKSPIVVSQPEFVNAFVQSYIF